MAQAKGKKIGRNKKHQAALYKSGGRLEINKKRKMLTHLRSNPLDSAALRNLQRISGNKDVLLPKLNHKGRRVLNLYRAREALHAKN